jgi:ferredoxin--NADP+ reductase
MKPGSDAMPLRVAVVGAGPAGFYTIQALLRASGLEARVDLFESLPSPFGLVRYGVAPDHEKIKSVTTVYDKLAQDPRCRFFGNVTFGRDLSLDELRALYHQIVFATGAQTDRRLNVPGEELRGSHPATEFVAWYNGHPDYSHLEFDLGCEQAIVVGVGNVAVDVARILCRTPDELATTDIADHALEALRHSRIREVWLIGRRGAAQASFTTPEVKELGELAGAVVSTRPEEVELDEFGREAVAADRSVARKVEILQSWAARPVAGAARCLRLRFLLSPVEVVGDERGRVRAVRLARNELYRGQGGVRSRSTEQVETLPAGLVFRSVGYRGVALPGLPFLDGPGIVPNDRGRIVAPSAGGLYVSGWIKRGPSGVIGTNKADAAETVAAMLEDLAAGRVLQPARSDPDGVVELLRRRAVSYLTYDDWLRIHAAETARGRAQGRPRVKFTRLRQFHEALGR